MFLEVMQIHTNLNYFKSVEDFNAFTDTLGLNPITFSILQSFKDQEKVFHENAVIEGNLLTVARTWDSVDSYNSFKTAVAPYADELNSIIDGLGWKRVVAKF
jgi:hypothetical protein